MFEKLSDVAFVADQSVAGSVRAVVLVFHGLNYTGQMSAPAVEELELAAHGALCVYPYYGPWSWMNRGARALVDEIVRRVYEEYKLAPEVPLILRGGSMGGHAALNYARYAKKTPVAVECNCPVADPAFHAGERPDLPRTFWAAYGMEGVSMREAFVVNSPLEQAESLPRAAYLIVHGTRDKAVSKSAHSDALVARMRAVGHDVEYVEARDMGHCAFVEYDVFRRYQDFALKAIRG